MTLAGWHDHREGNVFYFNNELKYAKGPNNANLENISILLKLCN
jgi:hypothetical protein